ncbi:TetR/AcrR family transcriptional regulator [Nocardia cyriacigeorgica]|uniref:TetR/AcrR family transcriptional regulator n=1 Tax=Nocardia cyriacigeorgica TaxID=135487 RepID=UPI0024558BC1|nr:TetR family transcriptional regulator [Nocardia cyriacigeorgica]
MSTPDRRTLIVDAAVELVAAQGIRALTHRAIDTALTLPAGSTSYYFRTKRALLEAMVDHITERTRADFLAAFGDAPPPTDRPRAELLTEIAAGVGAWLDRMLSQRRAHLVVRYALTIELSADPELHPRLVDSLFSHARAHTLFEHLGATDPATTAADFIAVIEGATFDRFAGARVDHPAGTPESVAQLTHLLSAYLRGELPG